MIGRFFEAWAFESAIPAPDHHRVVQQRRVPVGSGAQLRDELGEQRGVVDVDLGQLLQPFRIALMVEIGWCASGTPISGQVGR